MNTPYETLNETEWAEVDRIHELLKEEEIDDARKALDELMRRRPGHPDLRIEDATLKLEEGESHQALAALQGAERSADPARFFYLRAACYHELARFAEAEADAQRSVAVHPGYAMAHDLLSRILDHLGDAKGAAEASEVAAELDPENFPEPLEVSDDEFDLLVEKAVADLPAKVRAKLEEIPVLVQALPSVEMLKRGGTAAHPGSAGSVRGPAHLRATAHGGSRRAGCDLSVPQEPAARVRGSRGTRERSAHHRAARGRPPARTGRGRAGGLGTGVAARGAD